MPSFAEIVTGNIRFTDADWLELLEARRKAINPHLSTFTLQKIGNVECLRGPCPLTINKTAPDLKPILHSDCHADTSGLFAPRKFHVVKHNPAACPKGGLPAPDGSVMFWGLTRGGKWVIVDVNFTGKLDGHDVRETATSFIARTTNPMDMLSRIRALNPNLQSGFAKFSDGRDEPFGYKDLYVSLSTAVHEWMVRREELYRQAQRLSDQVRGEDVLIRHL